MTISEGARTYDVVVVGAGPVGENVAARARRGRLSACIVESRLVGGECSFYACIPTKAMLRPVNARAASARLNGLAPGSVVPRGVLDRRDSFTGRGDDSGQVEWLKSEGIDLVRGHGRLDGPRRVTVETPDGQVALKARHAVVLAVGSTAAIPPIDGLAEARPWTNVDASSAQEVPDRLLVLGGGVVACEFAQLYAGLGSAVTLVERSPRLLGRLEEFAAELVADGLQQAGVDLRTGKQVIAVRRSDGVVSATLSDGSTVSADEVLAALGRRPNTTDLGLESVGIEPGDYVHVDDTLQVPDVEGGWLYAVGDVNGRNLLTHMGKYQARAAGDVIAARANGEPDDTPAMAAWADHTVSTQVIFTDPEVCMAGMTQETAERNGLPVRAVEIPLSGVAGASLQADGYTGAAHMVVDEARRVVVGATFVGQDVAELLHSATVAIAGEVPLERLWHAVPPFPTISEVWLRVLEAYGL
ncbi:MAG: NAD(P)/FAD-dependent oxidoreductase [Actinomycetota bacterium]|nr:NAD(P)/FAD-dependent oxidoreductase [Actinomycetota bacterium]